MKKIFVFLTVLAIVLAFCAAFIGCDTDNGDSGSGGLTITGIPKEYNGKYAYAEGEMEDIDLELAAAKSINNDFSGKAVKISNGSVTLNVWEYDEAKGRFVSFKRSGEADFDVLIINTESFTENTTELADGEVFVKFKNGKGRGKFED